MNKTGLTLLTAAIGGLVAVGGVKLLEPKPFISFQAEQQKVNYVKVADHSAGLSSSGLPDFVGPAAVSTPAVVHITTTYRAAKGGGDDFSEMFGDMFGSAPVRGPQKAFGSGVIISPDGYIVTNNHVIEDANNIEVVLENKKSFKAKLIGTDPNTDIALLKIQAEGLPILKFGNSDAVKVGEWVLAVGNPFNLTSTVTAGIVSAKGRSIGILGNPGGGGNPHQQFGGANPQGPKVSRAVESFIQTDAAVNRGNSGGALVNMNAELVGINSAIASGSGNYEGYSFAVPVNLVKKVVDDLRNYGTVQRGYLGIELGEEVSAEFVKEQKLNDPDIRGVYVKGVSAGSSAAAVGIKGNDIITSIQGVPVNSIPELEEQVARYRPGDKLDVILLRNGTTMSFKVLLKNQEGGVKLIKKDAPVADVTSSSLEAQPLAKADLSKFGVPFGVRISRIGNGLLKDAGLKVGFIILKINDQPIKTQADITDAISSSSESLAVEFIDPKEPNVIQNFQRSTRN